jgi:hypothetical protein
MLKLQSLLSIAVLSITPSSAFMIKPTPGIQTRRMMAPSSFGYKDGGETSVTPSFLQPQIFHIDSLEDFLTFLAEDDRLCVVK